MESKRSEDEEICIQEVIKVWYTNVGGLNVKEIGDGRIFGKRKA